ncbi:MAG: flagellar filament capping protein FliD [Lachnospiraceae bacterium]|jgi:flagellar hook-associated protein 2|nr:flagellar filament capping protein FliD [Lachnospiraceae bacterium]
MPIRITGMNSGLDTESIIAELVKAQKTKVDTLKKKQTKHEWKQDAWKDLNTKIKKFYDGTLSNMRYESDYRKKTTKVSNTSAVSVITGANAINGSQKLKVKKVATTAYMTSAKLSGNNHANTQLKELGIEGDSKITVKTSGGNKEININGDMTIDSLVNEFRNAGLNANFDVDSQRFYISGGQSGAAGDFELEFYDKNGNVDLDTKSKLGFNTLDDKKYLDAYVEKYSDANYAQTLADAKTAMANAYKDEINIAANLIQSTENDIQKLKDEALADGLDLDDPANSSEKIKERIAELKKKDEADLTEAEKTELEELDKKLGKAEEYETLKERKQNQEDTKKQFEDCLNPDGSLTADVAAKVEEKVKADKEHALKLQEQYNNSAAGKTANLGHMTKGEDAVIELNGAEFTSSNNVFQINGLTITALEETDEAVTITTSEDTDGIYDMIKGFIKEYSALINEMDKLYNADSAKDYEPLTDEEKDAMSEKEIEKWEQKIKDSVLRRDSTLSTVSSALKEIMMGGIEVNGKTMHLSDFGIETLGYWNAADNEKNAYHINGDEDDEFTKNNEDKLRAAIANDPDSVVAFFTGLSKSLWGKVNTLMTKTDYSSSFTVYEDVRMKEEYDAYSEKIKKQEDKITALEDRWYKKFSAMETALAKMQSNQSAVTSLLGG